MIQLRRKTQDSSLPAGGLVARDLGKRVRLPDHELTILDGVSFTIAAGEAVAVVGASGSGKSTLLSLLAGLDVPSEGLVSLDGVVLSTLDEDGRARIRGEKVGFVFQSFQLLPALTALENVMLPLELRGDSEAQSSARSILQRVGLGERLEHYPRQLSGGEQQRVALARAFVDWPVAAVCRRTHRQPGHRDRPRGHRPTVRTQRTVQARHWCW